MAKVDLNVASDILQFTSNSNSVGDGKNDKKDVSVLSEISLLVNQIEKVYIEKNQLNDRKIKELIYKLIKNNIDFNEIGLNPKLSEILYPIYLSSQDGIKAIKASASVPIISNSNLIVDIPINKTLPVKKTKLVTSDRLNGINSNTNTNMNTNITTNTSKITNKLQSSNQLKFENDKCANVTSKNIDYLMEYKKKLLEKTLVTKIQNNLFVDNNKRPKLYHREVI